MMKRETRQTLLFKSEFSFNCLCDYCKRQEKKTNSEEQSVIDTKIEELIQNATELESVRSAAFGAKSAMMSCQIYPPELCRKELNCYKELYKLGKQRNDHLECLYDILKQGFYAAELEYQFRIAYFEYQFRIAYFMKTNENQELIEQELIEAEFKEECLNFAKTAEKYGKLLGNETVKPEVWKMRYENFEKYFSEKLHRMSSMYN